MQLLDIATNKNKETFLVMEYCEYNLKELVSKLNNGTLDLSHIKHIIHSVISGIGHIHSHDIIHRDLKPANLLICKNGTVKVADLGSSRQYFDRHEELSPSMVTLRYRYINN